MIYIINVYFSLMIEFGTWWKQFSSLCAEADRAAHRCEFCLDHIKQWAIFIWELALCTVGKTMSWTVSHTQKKQHSDVWDCGRKLNIFNSMADGSNRQPV